MADDGGEWLWSSARGWFQLADAAEAEDEVPLQQDWHGSGHWGWRHDTSDGDWNSSWWDRSWYGEPWYRYGNQSWDYNDSYDTTTWRSYWRDDRRVSAQTVLPDSVGDEEGWRQERNGGPSTTTASQGNPDPLTSGSTLGRAPKTGKEIIPTFDGTSSVRDYRRRVALFLSSTGIDAEYRAGRLVEQMSGIAWKSTETLDMQRLKAQDGVEYLLDHLQRELEPLEHMRVFGTLHHFFKTFRRQRGEEFVAYDLNFRSQMQKLDEVGGLQGIIKSWWFLECASLGPELRKQVITASGGSYQYEKLREALMALVPNVSKETSEAHPISSAGSGPSKKFFSQKTKIKQVNMVQDENEEMIPDEATFAEGQAPEEETEDPEELERQAQILMTQASRRRSQLEQGRGYSKPETKDQRDARIAEMKSRMCCSACKAHGRTVFGHWHSDKECPFYGKPVPASKPEGKGVFVVSQDAEAFSDTSDDAFMVAVSTIWQTFQTDGHVDPVTLALSDTCCAKTVAGSKWMTNLMQYMFDRGIHF